MIITLTNADAARYGYDVSDPATAERWARDVAEGRVVIVAEPPPEPVAVGICAECGSPFTSHGGTSTTLVGYFSAPGHDHDDNCEKRGYVCANGHPTVVSIRKVCPAPGCGWQGKASCWCCGVKVESWPGVQS